MQARDFQGFFVFASCLHGVCMHMQARCKHEKPPLGPSDSSQGVRSWDWLGTGWLNQSHPVRASTPARPEPDRASPDHVLAGRQSPRNQYPSQCHAGPQPVPFGSPASAQPVSTRPSQSHQCPDQSHQSRGSDIRPKYCNIRQVVCPANHIESEEQGGGHSLSRGTLERSEGAHACSAGARASLRHGGTSTPASTSAGTGSGLARSGSGLDGVLVGTGWDWLSPASPKSAPLFFVPIRAQARLMGASLIHPRTARAQHFICNRRP